jgi:hypothetical protein
MIISNIPHAFMIPTSSTNDLLYWNNITLQLNLLELKVTQHDRCILAITVLPQTSSGKHKVKIAGIMVSEEGGGEGVKNHMAIDMLMEGVSSNSTRGNAFDITTWAQASGKRLHGLDGLISPPGLKPQENN